MQHPGERQGAVATIADASEVDRAIARLVLTFGACAGRDSRIICRSFRAA